MRLGLIRYERRNERPVRLRVKQFVALTWLTALEALRQPICLLLAASSIALVTVLPALIMYTMGEPQKLVRDSALAVHFVGGLLLAAYTAVAAMQHEIKRGTVATVLTKPVGRTLFFLSKFCGVALVLILYSLAIGIATLLSARMVSEYYVLDWWVGAPMMAGVVAAFTLAGLLNYFVNKPFVQTAFWFLLGMLALVLVGTSFFNSAGQLATWGSMITWKIVPASLLITMALMVLAAIGVSLATRLDTVPTLSVCSVLFMVGLMSDYLFGRQAAQHVVAAVLYGLVPNWQHFWMTDALSGDGTIPWSYVGQVAVYALFYLAGVLVLGILAFDRMELKASA